MKANEKHINTTFVFILLFFFFFFKYFELDIYSFPFFKIVFFKKSR